MICPLMSKPLHVGNRKVTNPEEPFGDEKKQAIVHVEYVNCQGENCEMWNIELDGCALRNQIQ